ncbi:phosphatase PAP2 family protein [Desulfovibrio inopinatus]|uniref:phosphatase PAP2 family protein n=1 Tax=Desulfovibrio inopinatus TaxID=102109 RepID=UPI00146FB81E|nr:phosphatase PAP2 family protein [Desulfovibrio inopinatus]
MEKRTQRQSSKRRMVRLAALGLVLSLIFLGITGIVVDTKGNIPWDVAFSQWMKGKRTIGMGDTFFLITLFGKWFVTVPVMACGAWGLYRLGDAIAMRGLLVSAGLDYVLTNVVKWLVKRPRPSGAVYSESFYSFPSGHASIAMALYGFFVYLLLTRRKTGVSGGGIVVQWGLVVFAVLIVALGVSRLYLGVHYPTDVVAGYVLGGICLVVGAYSMENGRSTDRQV